MRLRGFVPRRRRSGAGWPVVAGLTLVLTGACGGGVQLLGGRLDGGNSDAAELGPDVPRDASSATSFDGSSDGSLEVADSALTQLCNAGRLMIPTAHGSACAGDVASQAFRFALCSCTELAWPGDLVTDSFDSTTSQQAVNGAVGVDGYVAASQPFHIGGSFWIAGQPPGLPGLTVVMSLPSEVAKDLHVGGGLVSQTMQTVGGDLYTDGNVTCPDLVVSGAIHVPVGSTVIGGNPGKGIIREPVAVAAPCDCDQPVLDIAGVISAFARDNDNLAGGVSDGTLASFGASKTLDLSCGRYHFQQISGTDLTLRLGGRTAIAVAGDVAISGNLTLELSPGAELDLFVLGNLKLTDGAFGSAARPAAVRAYVAGSSVVLPGGVTIDANIYAPAALLAVGATTEISGALFAQRFSFGGPVSVHYDQAILSGGGCPAASSTDTCSSCRDCGASAACRQGSCAACVTDTDCCAPLTCQTGRCEPVQLK